MVSGNITIILAKNCVQEQVYLARIRLLRWLKQQRRNKRTDACHQLKQHDVCSYFKTACIQHSFVLRAPGNFSLAKQFIIYSLFTTHAALYYADTMQKTISKHVRCFTPATKHVCLSTSALSLYAEQPRFSKKSPRCRGAYACNSPAPLEFISLTGNSGTCINLFFWV